MDASGTLNGDISLEKFGINSGIALYSFFFNAPFGIAYAGLEAFYPGGSYQALKDASDAQKYIDSKYGYNAWTRPRILPWGVK